MPLSRRYYPEHPPAEQCYFGLDMSFVIPFGVGITSGQLTIYTNTQPPVEASADWTVGAVEVRGRAVYALLTGGQPGVDYQLRWGVNDTQGNIWERTALILCAQTS